MNTRTEYVNPDGVSIAYQVLSESGPTLLNVPGIVSNLAFDDLNPVVGRYFEQMTRFARVIRFDKRGQGLSDRSSDAPTLEQQVGDIEAIREATETDRMALHGISHGATLAVYYALAYPERVSHLILTGGLCADMHDPYGSIAADNRLAPWDAVQHAIMGDFGGYLRGFARLANQYADEAGQDLLVRYFQSAGSAGALSALMRSLEGFDIRGRLPDVAVPTLVVHSEDDLVAPISHGRYYAEHIPGARLHYLERGSHLPFANDFAMPQLVAAIEEFLTGHVQQTGERVVVTILFTDIVDSTAQQKARGDDAWRTLRENFEARTRRCVEQRAGRIVEFTGDGVMAAFTTPGDALRAAQGLVNDARELGVEIRAGVHAGEAIQMGEGLSGTCVNIAARVCATAGAGEILTTQVVQGLVEGSGFTFTDRGEFDLKGIGTRRLVRLT